jgi:hypothetical protein
MKGAIAPMAAFSSENVLRARLVGLGMGTELFACLAQTNQSRLSRALRGLTPLSNEEAQRYLKLTEELQALANVMQPFQIVFADPRIVEVLLADFRAHREHWDQLESALTILRGCVEAATS